MNSRAKLHLVSNPNSLPDCQKAIGKHDCVLLLDAAVYAYASQPLTGVKAVYAPENSPNVPEAVQTLTPADWLTLMHTYDTVRWV